MTTEQILTIAAIFFFVLFISMTLLAIDHYLWMKYAKMYALRHGRYPSTYMSGFALWWEFGRKK